MTQKEAAMRILASKVGVWHKSYELVQKDVNGKLTGICPMERLYEVIKAGSKYESPNAIYTLEHRKIGKYAEFRVTSRTPKKMQIQGAGYLPSYDELIATGKIC